jgi:NADH-quinone oxidoreductase subunit M
MDTLRILLLCMLAAPLAAAVVVAALGPGRRDAVRWVSLAATLFSAVVSFYLAAGYADLATRAPGSPVGSAPTFQPELVTRFDLLPVGDGAIQFYVGLDGLNVWLVVLTALLMVPSVLVSWTAVEERVHEFYAWLLALATGMMGVFLAFDIILFYVFFELTLVPLFFLIGIWGGPERRYAARKFFIYTLTGGLITLLGLLGLVLVCYSDAGELTFAIPRLVELVGNRLALQDPQVWSDWRTYEFWIFLAMMVGFAVKVPLVPVHTWLPLAHVEAPTAGSVLLAGVLLKIGSYGFLRLCLPLAPDASLSFGVPLIGTLAVIGIIYGAWCALAQDDIKKLVAYSSVSHLGFCMLGMFALNQAGLSGALLQMINHGLSTGALFLLVGMLYERYHTRLMADYGGMAARLKLLSLAMVFICLTSIGLPGLNGFVGEALVFLGMFDRWQVAAVVGTAGILLGAWYLLTMVMHVFFGPLKEPAHEGHGPVGDLNGREIAALVPIVVLCFVLGLYPQPVLHTSERDLGVVAAITNRARERAESRVRTREVLAAKPHATAEEDRR